MNEKTNEQVLLPESDLIPLALVAAEVGETVDRMAYRFGDEVETDDVGMRSISASVARRFFTERAEQRARQEEQQRQRAGQKAQKPVVVGVPAVEGASAYESMLAATGLVTPDQEFGRREAPRFLEEALEAGARAVAEKRAQTARNKERAADKLKKDLR
jgi:hypothetical protein